MDLNLEPDMSFQVCCITLLVLALITSMKEADVSGSIAVLGLVANSVSSHQLMQTIVWITPLSILVDIFRLFYQKPGGFFIFLDIAEMVAKAAMTFWAHSLWRSFSSLGGPSATRETPANPFMATNFSSAGNGGGSGGYNPPAEGPTYPLGSTTNQA